MHRTWVININSSVLSWFTVNIFRFILAIIFSGFVMTVYSVS